MDTEVITHNKWKNAGLPFLKKLVLITPHKKIVRVEFEEDDGALPEPARMAHGTCNRMVQIAALLKPNGSHAWCLKGSHKNEREKNTRRNKIYRQCSVTSVKKCF